jgi:hypothetical protein
MEGQAEVAEAYQNGSYMNGTLAYQVRDPRTAGELAPIWNQTASNKSYTEWNTRSDVWVWFNEKGTYVHPRSWWG